MTTTINNIEFLRIKNDINGNPRYVVHYLAFLKPDNNLSVSLAYNEALKQAKKIGGKKFHNKQYGGGIVFQSYNLHDLAKDILSNQI
jgi:hypothetical protein